MRKILLIFFALLLFVPIKAQIIRGNNNAKAVVVYVAPTEGPEMLDNTGFDNTTHWTTSGDFSISGGVLNNAGVNLSLCYKEPAWMLSAVETSTTYTLRFTITSSAPGLYLKFQCANGTVDYIPYASYTTSTQAIEFTTGVGIGDGGLRLRAWGNASATIDNISLKKKL